MKSFLTVFTFFFVLSVQGQVPYEPKFPKIKTAADCTFIQNHINVDTVAPLKTAESEEATPMKGTDKKSDFGSSWKFYFILLAFPVILIILFILVFIRGK